MKFKIRICEEEINGEYLDLYHWEADSECYETHIINDEIYDTEEEAMSGAVKFLETHTIEMVRKEG